MARSLESQKRHYDNYINEILGSGNLYDFSDKEKCVSQHIKYMLNRTQSMFEWKGLPDSIPERSLELFLQTNGNVCFYRHENSLYVFTGGLGGAPDPYYMPTLYTIANPALKLSKSLIIGQECVVMPNDSLYIGLLPLFSRYATGLTENELSLKLAIINTRIIDVISAPDDRTKASAEKFLQDISNGHLGVIAENSFLEGIKAQPYGKSTSNSIITNLIELEQYYKASWFNELGLNANYNMKREHLITSENEMNSDSLLPLVDNMLKCRQVAVENVNKMFGTNISVDLSSSWKNTQIESQQEIKESSISKEDNTSKESNISEEGGDINDNSSETE